MGILGSLIITVIAYMAVPMIMLATNGGKFPKKKATRIAIWNSVIVGILFLILTIAFEATAGWTPMPAVLYFWINRAILIERGTKEKNDIDDKIIKSVQEHITKVEVEHNSAESSDAKQVTKTNVEQLPKISFCRKCGNKLIVGSVFCNKCGSKVDWN